MTQERLQLNEGTLWAGGPCDPVNPQAKEALPPVRRLIKDGKCREAAQLSSAKVMAKPLGQMPYQTVGDLLLNVPGSTNITDHRRDLDLDTPTATFSYTLDGVGYTRGVFANAPDNVVAMRLAADKPGKISFVAGMKTPIAASVDTDGNDTIVMRGMGGDAGGIKGQLKYQARVKVIAKGGKATAASGKVSVLDADEVTLLITAAISGKKFDDVRGDPESIVKQQLAATARKWFAERRTAHLADYQVLFRRVKIDLGQSEAMKLPTHLPIKLLAEGNGPQLAALYYQFAPYLLISNSRPGGQSAPPQGL